MSGFRCIGCADGVTIDAGLLCPECRHPEATKLLADLRAVPPHQHYPGDGGCAGSGCLTRWEAVASHTRTSTGGFGPDFCTECSEAISEWVAWPCPRAVRGTAEPEETP